MDNQKNKNTAEFTELLQSFNLVQRVKTSTQEICHTLDLMITRTPEESINSIIVKSTNISDHFTVYFNIDILKHSYESKTLNFRKTKEISIESFKQDITDSNIVNDIGAVDTMEEILTAFKTNP